MYSKLQLAHKYIHYYLTASNGKGHGIHPPFVYDFVINVLSNKKQYAAYQQVEQLRSYLLANNRVIEVEDFGAGSVTKATAQRSIASICSNAAKPKKYAQLLYRIVAYYNATTIIELGTSLGISTSYMAMAAQFGKVITCEGSTSIALQAKKNFAKLCLNNITVLQGEFETSYSKALQECKSIDILFIDGNHQYEPTIAYFEKALPYLHQNSIIIFDDIHWSKPMEAAWHKIKQHELVSETVDLFFIGICFFRKEQKAKQHFIVKF